MQRTVKNYAEAPTSPIGSKGPLKNRLKITSVVQYPDGYAFTSSKKPGSLFTFLSVFQPMLSRYTFITSHLFHRLPLHSSLPLIMPYNHGRKHRRSLHVSETTSLLQPVEQEPTVTWRETWSLVRPYVTPNTLRLRLLACFSLLMVFSRKAVTLVRPYGYKLAVDAFANNLVMGTTTVPYIPVIMFVVAGLASNLFNCLRNMSYSVVSSDATKRFGVDMFDHLQCLSLAFHLQRKTGEVTKVMDRGIQSIDSISNTVLFTLLPTMVEACVVTGIFVHLGTPYIALTVFLSVVAYFFFTFTMTTWRIKFRREVNDADNVVSDKAVDTLMNYETVKMFGMESEEVSAYSDLQNEYMKKFILFRFSLNALNFGQSTIQALGLGASMILAARRTALGGLTAGDFVLINTYVSQLYQPLFFLGSSYRMLTQASTDLEKCVKLFKTEITVQDAEDAKPLCFKESDVLQGRAGDIRFEKVSFMYTGSERGSAGGLRNISFHVKPGNMVALVGASGAGKSTIMRLLLRFYDVDSGAILIDGQNINSFTLRSLRKEVGVVAQDTVLFNQTLRYNISYGKEGATDAEIFAAARSAALGPFIESLPLGLDTTVGERGVRLSGGERQRVGCARCIIKSPSIVLLDEASSALDTNTEREMQANLREVCKNRTTIVVAHRLSTIMMADEIIVLGKDTEKDICGSIVERGKHCELISAGGIYAEMWEAQTNMSPRDDTEKEATDNGSE